MVALNLSFGVLVVAALVTIGLGFFADQEPGPYLTAVGLILSHGAFTLLFLVLSQGRPQPASDQAGVLETGGSSA